MAKQFVEIEMDVPDGYKVVGYRFPKKGELYLSLTESASVVEAVGDFKHAEYPILEKTKQWVPATYELFVKTATARSTDRIACRVRLHDNYDWKEGMLLGVGLGAYRFAVMLNTQTGTTKWYPFCEIEV